MNIKSMSLITTLTTMKNDAFLITTLTKMANGYQIPLKQVVELTLVSYNLGLDHTLARLVTNM